MVPVLELQLLSAQKVQVQTVGVWQAYRVDLGSPKTKAQALAIEKVHLSLVETQSHLDTFEDPSFLAARADFQIFPGDGT